MLRPQAPDLKLSTAILDDGEMLRMVEAELESVVNAYWDSDPNLARAFGLLNQKINLLTAKGRPSEQEIRDRYPFSYADLEVSLSASGIAFYCDAELEVGNRLEILLMLDSAITGLTVKGSVVQVENRLVNDRQAYFSCVEFDIETQQKEQLIRHIARRQVNAIGKREHAL